MGVKLHFLNVGPGDCTIIHLPSRTTANGRTKSERIMMVDIYHHEEHEDYEDIIEYYKDNFKDSNGNLKPIFRFICTHPHQDHICGLAKLLEDNDIEILNFWDFEHDWEPESFDGHLTHEDDWNAYLKASKSEKSPKSIKNKRESTPSQFWNDDEDRIEVLSPCDALVESAHYKEDGTKRGKTEIEIDEMSYALMIKVNSRKIILAGDGRETPFWSDIYDNCKEKIMNCTILKAGHHGQEASFHEDAVKSMNPEFIIFSNSEDLDEKHGAESLYKKASPTSQILKTCNEGTIVLKCPFDSNESVSIL